MSTIYSEPGILMTKAESMSEPLSATFLIKNENDYWKELYRKTLATPLFYQLNHKYAKNTLPPEKAELFSVFDDNALLYCTSTYCSSPIYTIKDLEAFLKKNY